MSISLRQMYVVFILAVLAAFTFHAYAGNKTTTRHKVKPLTVQQYKKLSSAKKQKYVQSLRALLINMEAKLSKGHLAEDQGLLIEIRKRLNIFAFSSAHADEVLKYYDKNGREVPTNGANEICVICGRKSLVVSNSCLIPGNYKCGDSNRPGIMCSQILTTEPCFTPSKGWSTVSQQAATETPINTDNLNSEQLVKDVNELTPLMDSVCTDSMKKRYASRSSDCTLWSSQLAAAQSYLSPITPEPTVAEVVESNSISDGILNGEEGNDEGALPTTSAAPPNAKQSIVKTPPAAGPRLESGSDATPRITGTRTESLAPCVVHDFPGGYKIEPLCKGDAGKTRFVAYKKSETQVENFIVFDLDIKCKSKSDRSYWGDLGKILSKPKKSQSVLYCDNDARDRNRSLINSINDNLIGNLSTSSGRRKFNSSLVQDLACKDNLDLGSDGLLDAPTSKERKTASIGDRSFKMKYDKEKTQSRLRIIDDAKGAPNDKLFDCYGQEKYVQKFAHCFENAVDKNSQKACGGAAFKLNQKKAEVISIEEAPAEGIDEN